MKWNTAAAPRCTNRVQVGQRMTTISPPRELSIQVLETKDQMGRGAATHAANLMREAIREQGWARLIFSAANSQLPMLERLTSHTDINWSRVEVFHADEYRGMAASHPASFRGLLSRKANDWLFQRCIHADNETPIVCNGFKDDEYIEMVMLASKIGRRIIPVVEKYTELDLILKHSAKVGVRPVIGLRIKLASRGSGRWKSSGGYRSKFGLTVTEALRALDQLKAAGMEDCLQLLHFHLGSQITNIRQIKGAVVEAARVYVELKRAGAGLCYMDVGGGLGIDYDGSQTDFESSVNYTLQEYANDVVYHIQSVCDEAEVPHPTIVSESGRAIAAYHSVLVFNVLGVTGFGDQESMPEIPDDVEQPLIDLKETLRGLSNKNLLESFHDAQQSLDSALNLFSLGYLPLQQRSWAESIYWVICRRIQKLGKELDYFPEELEGLDGLLSDTYFCNFSLFQSMPDSWAVKQLFPIMPIHRLDTEPHRHGILGDISCDSDGKVDQFIDRRDVKKTLPLHSFNGEPYYLGSFLVGAYQEILGDLHNLFGDTNAVHVRLDEKGGVVLDAVIRGDTVREVLDYVQFQSKTLLEQFRKDVEAAVRDGHIGYEESGLLLRFYEEGLNGYTYLEQ